MDLSHCDPKGLIHESYRIEGITAAECRSIFLDWALSVPEGIDSRDAIEVLLSAFAAQAPDHPMTQVLQDGRVKMANPRRRGGWRSRPRD
ncbi:hypothetical protein J7382_08300 [Shimia sp. R11_0]|uniref:Uncharacterized protein n=1 Tax=Shimia marina TaxID=321267 RepID=A0A0P1ER76_9RHOB|nr:MULTISPECIES: hypothetical protein [Shimia]MBO9477530.1 hypothetical protein [Shimia sp. R11_0]CUH53017.1 hypothetical protein SHM7688_02468 [Shimia marina]SFD92448.1 hypothetical protein SAMN04488037_103268 [Shimia marina]